MKYVVKVADRSYEVEIDDLNARPVVARIDGQEFKVTPEEKRRAAALPTEKSEFKPGALSTGISSTELTAPLPGTVIEIFVKPGEYVEMGQVMLIIEAMKMKNS